MKKISEKSITDLEFDIVLQQAAERCATDLGKKALLDLLPYTSLSRVQIEIERVNEFKSSYASEHNIPNHGFESIDKALELLSQPKPFCWRRLFLLYHPKILNSGICSLPIQNSD